MSIIDRIKRITQANIHHTLDQLESPERMLQESVRAMEHALIDAKQAAADFALTLKKLEQEQSQLKRLRAEWQSKAEQAVKVGEEGVARQALGEKIKAEDRIKTLEPTIKDRTEKYDELKENLAKLQDQLKEAKMKVADLQSRKKAAAARKAFDENLGKSSADHGSDLEKFESEVMRTEAEAEVNEDLRGVPDVDEQIDKKTAQLRIEAELKNLKKRAK